MGTVTLPCLFVTEKLDAGPPGRGRPPAPLISSKPHLEKSKIFFGEKARVGAVLSTLDSRPVPYPSRGLKCQKSGRGRGFLSKNAMF